MKGEFFHGVEMHCQGEPIDPADLSVPNFAWLGVMFEPGSVVDLAGREVGFATVLVDFQRDLEAVISAIQSGSEPPPLFVPDLWHVAKGRAKSYPPEEGDFLWNVCLFGNRIGRQFYGREVHHVSHNQCGHLFTEPIREAVAR